MSLPAAIDHGVDLSPAAFIADALPRLMGAGKIAIVTVPAPVAPLETLWRVAQMWPARSAAPALVAPAMQWAPPEGPRFAGIGSAVELCTSGPRRIEQMAAKARALWAQAEHVCHPSARAPTPRLFGGFAFAHGAAEAPPWDQFGDARFVLPTWCYGVHEGHAWLSLAIDNRAGRNGHADRDDRAGRDERTTEETRADAWPAQLDHLLAHLHAPEHQPPAPANALAMHEMPEAEWRRHIEDIRRAIAGGSCAKIVAARASEITLDRDIDPVAVLARLEQRFPDCHRFGFAFDQAAFVAASPERLVTRAGDRVLTQALAGSIAAPGTAESPATLSRAAAALLASAKDREEQVLVVRAIERVLAPLCSRLDIAPEPEIRALRNVLHLETRIEGMLANATHVLDLVAALHPTPAVGGEPTEMALRWIAECEPALRGWYAAPVGWFDANGDGEFAVAIRSGVLAGRRAHLYVGAGIVRDSDPDAEYRETGLKQTAMLGALGVIK